MNDQAKKYVYAINGKKAMIADPTPTPKQLLAEAGFEPAEDYVLIGKTSHGTNVNSFDDVLNLSANESEFFAFTGGQIFEVTVNDHSIWWGDEKIEVDTLRRLGNVSEGDDLIWQRLDSPNETLSRSGEFALNGNRIEHLKSHPRSAHEYHLFVDGVKYTTELDEITGAQIMAMIAGWDPANSLVLESHGNDPDEVIRPTTVVDLKGRQGVAHFTIVPPATFGAA